MKIIGLPAPLGFGLKTSLAAVKRFHADYARILMDEKKLAAHCRTEEQRAANDAAFRQATASDETFRQTAERQIRKRLFNAANDPQSNYQEIRWLVKTLEHLRKPNEKPTPSTP